MPALRISVFVARAHLAFAAERGIALDGVLAEHGVGRADLDDDDGEVDVVAMNALWREMERQVGPDYGILLAERQVAPLGVVDHCLRFAPDGLGSLRALIAYQRLFHGPARGFFLDEDAARGVVTVRFVPPLTGALPRGVADFILCRQVVMLRRNTGLDIAPLRAAFCHVRPASIEAYRRVLRCPITFDAPAHSIEFDAASLAVPLLAADPALDAILGRHARALLARRPDEIDLVSDVRRSIAEGLRGGAVPGASDVARRLSTSERTLRRRLDESGTSFHGLVDEVRRELAADYLRDPRIKTLEVAFLCGFSDASTFHRAFRRWTGTTPVAFRRTLAAPANRLSGGAIDRRRRN